MSGTKSDAEWFEERVPHAGLRPSHDLSDAEWFEERSPHAGLRPSHDLSDAEWFDQATGARARDHGPADPVARGRDQAEPPEHGDE